MDDCIFCKIVKGEIPCYKIYEDKYVLAFLDIAEDIDGHTLVIPKEHCTNILDCQKQNLNHIMEAVQKISNHYVDDCGYDGIDIINANGESAQQTVFHLHIHIIPRKNGDKVNVWPKFSGAKNKLEIMQNKLKIK